MTTKTTKKQAESTPEPTTDAPPAGSGVGWTIDDWTAHLAAMKPDVFERFMGLVSVMERQQQRAEMIEVYKRRVDQRQNRIARMRELHKGDMLDDAERMSLHVVGKLAMGMYLTRSALADGGLDGLFQTINEGIRESLAQVGTMELDIIAEGEAAKQEIAAQVVADALAQVDDESDDEADGDSE